jgi:RimJ/RimL family protein N-acetyltransferase
MIGVRPINIETDWSSIKKEIGIPLVEDLSGLFFFDKETGKRWGVVVLHTWQGKSVQAHVIVWDRAVLKEGGVEILNDYVFNQCGVDYMYSTVLSTNEKALKFDKRMGAKEMGRMPNAYAEGVDIVMMSLSKADCNYLPKREEAA